MPVRTVGEQAYRIRELRVRFYRADMMFKPSPEAADEYLKGVVNAAGKESSSAAAPDVLTALRNGKTPRSMLDPKPIRQRPCTLHNSHCT